MTLCGIPEFLAYSLECPGDSRFKWACQGSELMIGLAKMFCRECGTGKSNMPDLLANYLDLSGTSMVANNQVNFEKILKQLENEKLLIFDPNKTPLIERSIEEHMAPLMKYIVNLLDQFNVGDEIPQFLQQILNAMTLDVNSLDIRKVQKILYNSNVNTEADANSIDIFSEDYNEVLKAMHQLQSDLLKNKSFKSPLKVCKAVINNQI